MEQFTGKVTADRVTSAVIVHHQPAAGLGDSVWWRLTARVGDSVWWRLAARVGEIIWWRPAARVSETVWWRLSFA